MKLLDAMLTTSFVQLEQGADISCAPESTIGLSLERTESAMLWSVRLTNKDSIKDSTLNFDEVS